MEVLAINLNEFENMESCIARWNKSYYLLLTAILFHTMINHLQLNILIDLYRMNPFMGEFMENIQEVSTDVSLTTVRISACPHFLLVVW